MSVRIADISGVRRSKNMHYRYVLFRNRVENMSIITDEKITNDFYAFYTYYINNVYDVSFFDFNKIYYIDDIDKDLEMFGISSHENSCGVTILPNEVLSEEVIVICPSRTNVYENAQTIFHELTHVYDNNRFSKHYNHNSLVDLNKIEFHHTYTFFSEFHASAFSEMHAMNCIDIALNKNYFKGIMTNWEKLLLDYISDKRAKLLNQCFTWYDLSQLLGKFYLFDKHNHINEIEKSCIYPYLPELFHSDKKYQIFDLYQICWNSMKEDDIFHHLRDMQDSLDKVYSLNP